MWSGSTNWPSTPTCSRRIRELAQKKLLWTLKIFLLSFSSQEILGLTLTTEWTLGGRINLNKMEMEKKTRNQTIVLPEYCPCRVHRGNEQQGNCRLDDPSWTDRDKPKKWNIDGFVWKGKDNYRTLGDLLLRVLMVSSVFFSLQLLNHGIKEEVANLVECLLSRLK